VSIVVSDTSPLHYLILCGAEEALSGLFERVLIPPTVFEELQQTGTPAPVREWARSLPPWVAVQAPSRLDLSLELDAGELEAISLAQEIKAAAVLMDDRAGRIAAVRFGLVVVGTLGILEAAAVKGLIDLPQVLGKLNATNVRLDPALVEAALSRDEVRKSPKPSS
jgi:predicted nucleic acid-binding protein